MRNEVPNGIVNIFEKGGKNLKIIKIVSI